MSCLAARITIFLSSIVNMLAGIGSVINWSLISMAETNLLYCLHGIILGTLVVMASFWGCKAVSSDSEQYLWNYSGLVFIPFICNCLMILIPPQNMLELFCDWNKLYKDKIHSRKDESFTEMICYTTPHMLDIQTIICWIIIISESLIIISSVIIAKRLRHLKNNCLTHDA